MNDWSHLAISPDATIASAIAVIDRAPGLPALVIESGKLLGLVSDIELRQAMLGGLTASAPIREIMVPKTAIGNSRLDIVLANDGTIQEVSVAPQMDPPKPIVAVLMAGGPGKRLYPLTENCPKPLLTVKGKPLLHTTLENLVQAGFKQAYIAVNYKAEMVKDYFGNGKSFGIEITYLQENERLGTAGALGLIQEHHSEPLLVMNGDVVTKLNFEQLVEFHRRTNSTATMCVRKYEYQIPYGVVQLSGHRINGLKEKPVNSFFVNAGIYVVNGEIPRLVPHQQYLDMPSLFEQLMQTGRQTSAFPIREQWIDIGDKAEYERAQNDTPTDFVATVQSAAPVSF